MNSDQSQAFHHRHLPTLTRWTTAVGWKFSHLFLPLFIHYLTDKYKGKRHHLIVDTFLSLVVFMMIALNGVLGLFIYVYSTPAQFQVTLLASNTVISGKDIQFRVVYTNPKRDVADAEVAMYFPDGFIPTNALGAVDLTSPVLFSLGAVPAGAVGTLDFSGVVLGDVGSSYQVDAAARYTYLNRRQAEISTHDFTVRGSSFHSQLHFPEATVYGVPFTATITYNNDSVVARDDIRFDLNAPNTFVMQRVTAGPEELNYNVSDQSFTVAHIAAHEQGTIEFTGLFTAPPASGDQQIQIELSTSTTSNGVRLTESAVSGGLDVYQQRGAIDLSGPSSVNFGDTVELQLTVRNSGQVDLDDIRPNLRFTSEAFVHQPSSSGGQMAQASDGAWSIPAIDHLGPDESVSLQVRIPTRLTDGQTVSGTVEVSALAYSPLVDADVPLSGARYDVQFTSQVDLTAVAYYTGPNGEPFGYGPEPPVPGQVTAYRLFLLVHNHNNPIQNVHLTTVLPSQVDWTDLTSVSAGTALSFDPSTRTVSWHIPLLDPQVNQYGAEFEVRFLPNYLQIGLRPQLFGQSDITATDGFTGAPIRQTVPAVLIPQPVIAQ